MMLIKRQISFSTAVLCAGPAGVFFAHGLEIEGNPEAGLVRVRAVEADGSPMLYSVIVDLNGLSLLRRICSSPSGAGILQVGGGTSVSGCDEEGVLMMKVQSTLEIERDTLGVLVLAPGPDIPWALGIPADNVEDFLASLADCAAGAALSAVA
jgi:hypothetical protein